jgi:hypothetical protein
MTAPERSRDGQSALTDPRDVPVLVDVEIQGDAFDDPDYRALLGID